MPDTNEQGWSEATRTAVNGMTHMSMSQNLTNPRGEHIQLGTGNSCIESLLEKFLATPTSTVNASCIAAISPTTYTVPAATTN